MVVLVFIRVQKKEREKVPFALQNARENIGSWPKSRSNK